MIPAGTIIGGINTAGPQVNPAVAAMPDLSQLPLSQLTQIAQTSADPGTKAAAVQEIARRGSQGNGLSDIGPGGGEQSPTGANGSSYPGMIPPTIGNVWANHDPDTGLAAVAANPDATSAPQQGPPSGPQAGGLPPGSVRPQSPGAPNPALNPIATGAAAANAIADNVPQAPSFVDQGVPPSAAVPTASAQNPAIAAANGFGSPSSIGALASQIPTALTPEDKMLALARGFGTLASSRQPGFLGALGEGIDATAAQLQQDRENDVKNQQYNLDTGLREQSAQETNRSNLAQEGQGQTRLQIAADELKNAQAQLAFEQQKWQQGFGSDNALKLAQIGASQAQADYYRAEAGNVGGTDVQTDQGYGRFQNGKFTPAMGPNGQPVNQQYKPSATMDKYTLLTSAGVPAPDAAQMVAGQKQPSATQIENAASFGAKNASSMILDPTQAQQVYNQEYARIKASLTGGGLSSVAPPPAAPAAAAPAVTIGQTATNPTTGQKVQWNGSAWVPVK